MGKYMGPVDGLAYITFLATGLPITAAMFTAAFECSYGTFIRLEFDKVYEGMLAAPITVKNLLLGEILWAGTKGFFFSLAVTIVVALFGLVPLPWTFLTPIVGFLTGVMFATLSLLITSFVRNINHFNFFFTGFLSPMFFFSGVVFPIQNLPVTLRWVAEIFPLTHVVRICRSLDTLSFSSIMLFDLFFILIFTLITGWFAIKRLSRRLIR
jgi:lipooligosaccharide transport system permease protein